MPPWVQTTRRLIETAAIAPLPEDSTLLPWVLPIAVVLLTRGARFVAGETHGALLPERIPQRSLQIEQECPMPNRPRKSACRPWTHVEGSPTPSLAERGEQLKAF